MRSLKLILTSLALSMLQAQVFAQQDAAAGATNGSRSEANSSDRKKLERRLEDAIARRIKETLEKKVDEFLSRRIERTGYTIEIESSVDKKRVERLIGSLREDEISSLILSIGRRDYDALRPYLKSANINLGIANYLSESEWAPVVNTLQAQFESAGDRIESIETNQVSLPLPLQERAIKTQAKEELKKIEREYQLKRDSIQFDRELELDNFKEIQLEKERRLETELENERKEKEQLSKELLNSDNLTERMIKEKPLLTRLLATGAGIGSVLFFALLALGTFLILGLRFLGRSILRGTTEMARAMRAGPEQMPMPKQVEPFSESTSDLPEIEKEDLLVEFDSKPQFKEAADQLRTQVVRDLKTSGAVLSKMVEQEKYGEVVAIFDLLGPDLSQQVFAAFSPIARRLMQRAYFTGSIKRVRASTLFNRVNEIRSMLATTDVLMKDGNDKQFAQVMLSHSDEDVARAIDGLAPEQAGAMMTILPPDRMLKIIRKLEPSFGKEVLNALGSIVHLGKRSSEEVLEKFTKNIFDEKKMKFEEDKKYLQSIVEVAEQNEQELISHGLEFNARLLLEVIGIRATLDDLWAQPIEVLEGLFSLLELEPGTAMLFTSPQDVRAGVMKMFPERKRILTEDALENMSKDDIYREGLLKSVPVSRKVLLQKLSEMAASGIVTLPSRVKLFALAEEQERQSGQPLKSDAPTQMIAS
jgi:hypothetical protein